MRVGDGGGADWLRSQAEASLRAKQLEVPPPDDRKQKAQAIADALGELVKTVALQQQRLQRYAMWWAAQTARIVELRSELRTQWLTNHRLVLENAELRAELGKHLGGTPVKFYGVPEGETKARGVWGALQATGGAEQIAALSPEVSYDADMNTFKVEVDPDAEWTRPTSPHDPLAEQSCARCSHVRAVHAGGVAEGPCTACDSCETYVDAAQVNS